MPRTSAPEKYPAPEALSRASAAPAQNQLSSAPPEEQITIHPGPENSRSKGASTPLPITAPEWQQSRISTLVPGYASRSSFSRAALRESSRRPSERRKENSPADMPGSHRPWVLM